MHFQHIIYQVFTALLLLNKWLVGYGADEIQPLGVPHAYWLIYVFHWLINDAIGVKVEQVGLAIG